MRSIMIFSLFCIAALLGAGCASGSREAASVDTVNQTVQEPQEIVLSVNQTPLTVSWEKNESVTALTELLQEGAVIIETERFGGFEQVGNLPCSLPRKDVSMTAEAGDIMLYTGNSIVLFYGSNTWTYTKLGHIEGLSGEELNSLLNSAEVTVTLSVSD